MIAPFEVHVQSVEGQKLTLAPLQKDQLISQPFDDLSVQYVETPIAQVFPHPEGVWDVVSEDPNAITWALLAGHERAYIGMGLFRAPGPDTMHPSLERFISSVAGRGKGYGTMAALAISEVAFSFEVESILSTTGNPAARRSLAKLGFVEFATDGLLPCGRDATPRPFTNHLLYNLPGIKEYVTWEDEEAKHRTEASWRTYEQFRARHDISIG